MINKSLVNKLGFFLPIFKIKEIKDGQRRLKIYKRKMRYIKKHRKKKNKINSSNINRVKYISLKPINKSNHNTKRKSNYLQAFSKMRYNKK